MNVGWMRGWSRALGFDLQPAIEFAAVDEADQALLLAADCRAIVNKATIVHERTHWLQLIATTSGIFHTSVWEAQAVTAQALIRELGYALGPESFPLRLIHRPTSPAVAISPRASQLVAAWRGMHDLQGWFYGNRGVAALNLPTRVALELWSDFLKEWLIKRLPGQDAAQHDEAGRYRIPPEFKSVRPIENKGRTLGAYHLMECAARFSDHVVLQHGLSKLSARFQVDEGRLREGCYGIVREHFYRISGRGVDERSEAILAVLVHEALNTPLPPVSPMDVMKDPWELLNPFGRFVGLAKATADYTASAAPSLGLDEFRRIEFEIHARLVDQGVALADEALADHVRRLFGGSDGAELPAGLYTIDGKRSRPVDFMRYRLIGKLHADAFDAARQEPTLVSCPGLLLVSDPVAFHRLFDRIKPPIHHVAGEGFRPTYADPAAHAVLMLDALVGEILRGVMHSNYITFIAELRSFVTHVKDEKYIRDGLQVALLNAGFKARMADKIASDI